MFDRIELIKAFNSILELMFDEFCQVCSRLAIYRKMRKNSLSAQFSVEKYIVFIIKSFSSSNRFHYQIVFIIKSFSSSNRFHHQIVFIIKSSSSSNRSHHQAVLIIKSYYQAIVTSHLSSQSIKSFYQVTLSNRSKHSKAIVTSDRSKISKYACYDRLKI
jgi:hypothetical protein